MRAMVLDRTAPAETAPLAPRDVPIPEPGPGDVRLRVAACGVCRTDLHVVEGDLPQVRRPLVPGHQIVGVVDAAGPGVASPAVGERAGVAWLQGTCGACRFCGTGRENLCETPRFTGWHADGGFAEFAVAPARWTYPLPAAMSDEQAAPLLCAGIIGYRALRLADAGRGARLGLYGFGASAHIAIQLARHRGCEVYVASLRENHREHARRLGAVWTGAADALPPERLDAAIVFAPAGEIVPAALRALDRGGRCVCAGIHMSPIPRIDYDTELFGERVLRSVTANTREDGDEFLREAVAADVRTDVVPYPLAEANRALADLKAGRFDGAAVLRVG